MYSVAIPGDSSSRCCPTRTSPHPILTHAHTHIHPPGVPLHRVIDTSSFIVHTSNPCSLPIRRPHTNLPLHLSALGRLQTGKEPRKGDHLSSCPCIMRRPLHTGLAPPGARDGDRVSSPVPISRAAGIAPCFPTCRIVAPSRQGRSLVFSARPQSLTLEALRIVNLCTYISYCTHVYCVCPTLIPRPFVPSSPSQFAPVGRWKSPSP